MTKTEFISALVACYGAVLSTYNAIANWREKRRKVKVVVSHGLPVYGSELGEASLIIGVQNHGFRPVRITNVTFGLPDKSSLMFKGIEMDRPIPCELKDGETVRKMIEIQPLVELLVQRGHRGTILLRGIASDAVGSEYRSSPYELDIDGWLRRKQTN